MLTTSIDNQKSSLFIRIDEIISSHSVVLFMKGTAEQPACGFSSFVAQVLQKHHIQFKDINILRDEELRQSIKEYSQWPTIPQLYIKGEFIGGADIMRDLYTSGELIELLDRHGISYTTVAESQ